MKNDYQKVLIKVTVSLMAAISLLRSGGKPMKMAATSDRMFDQMVDDYKKSVEMSKAFYSTLDEQPMDTIPKDGTMIWLHVDYSNGYNPLEDAKTAWTLGFNLFDDTGIDEWQFVGWNWEQDVFCDGGGEVIGWGRVIMPTPIRRV